MEIHCSIRQWGYISGEGKKLRENVPGNGRISVPAAGQGDGARKPNCVESQAKLTVHSLQKIIYKF